MINEITKLKFTVRFSDCDEYSRLKLSRLFQFMEETSIVDAERNGFGIWKMMQAGYTSVVTRMKLRINHTPLLGEELNVSTWIKENYKDKVLLKDYAVTDSQGRALVEGTSSWLLVNLKTGLAEPPSSSPFELPIFEGKNAMPEMLDILPPGPEPTLVYTECARNSDLDINHHVNHCRYVDWVIDALSKKELKERGIRSIQMNFIQQIPLAEQVSILRFKDTNHHAVFFGINTNDAKANPENPRSHFQARIGFRD